jgi:hypothetical protein
LKYYYYCIASSIKFFKSVKIFLYFVLEFYIFWKIWWELAVFKFYF